MKPYTMESVAESAISEMLHRITGHRYSFAIASNRCWDNADNAEADNAIGFFQLMPDDGDDGFFDTYCDERPWHQFFRSKEDCVLNFLYYWSKWKRAV